MRRYILIALCLFAFTEADGQTMMRRRIAAGGGAPAPDTATIANVSAVSDAGTFSHDNNGDFLLVIAVDYNTTHTAATYAGASMTLARDTTSAALDYVSIWYRDAPASGTNNVVITGASTIRAIAVSITNGGSISSSNAAIGKGNAHNFDVTSDPTEVVVDAVSSYTSTLTEGAGQTVLMKVSTFGASTWKLGAATVNMSWAHTANPDWSHVAVSVDP